jgi:hypothetical protein
VRRQGKRLAASFYFRRFLIQPVLVENEISDLPGRITDEGKLRIHIAAKNGAVGFREKLEFALASHLAEKAISFVRHCNRDIRQREFVLT